MAGSESYDPSSRGLKAMMVLGVFLVIIPLVVYLRQNENTSPGNSEAEADNPPIEGKGATIEVPVDASRVIAEEPPENPDIDWVIAAHLRALGGAEKLLEVHSMIIESEALVVGEIMKVVSMRKRPRFVFQKIQIGEIEKRLWSDGSSAWEEVSRNGDILNRKLFRDEEFEGMVAGFDYDDPTVRFAFSEQYSSEDDDLELRLEGEGVFAGNPGYWLMLTGDLRMKLRIFINRKTLMVDFKEAERGGIRISNTFSDYREVDGLMLPFRQVIDDSRNDSHVIIEVKRYRLGAFMYTGLFYPDFAEQP